MNKTLTWTPVKTIEDACGYADGHDPEVAAKYGQHVPGCGGPQVLGSMTLDGRPYRSGTLDSVRVAEDWARIERAAFERADIDA